MAIAASERLDERDGWAKKVFPVDAEGDGVEPEDDEGVRAGDAVLLLLLLLLPTLLLWAMWSSSGMYGRCLRCWWRELDLSSAGLLIERDVGRRPWMVEMWKASRA